MVIAMASFLRNTPLPSLAVLMVMAMGPRSGAPAAPAPDEVDRGSPSAKPPPPAKEITSASAALDSVDIHREPGDENDRASVDSTAVDSTMTPDPGPTPSSLTGALDGRAGRVQRVWTKDQLRRTPGTTLAEALQSDGRLGTWRPAREGLRHEVAAWGLPASATTVLLDGAPIRGILGPGADLGLVPLEWLESVEWRSDSPGWIPTGPGGVVALDPGPAGRARPSTRLLARRGQGRELAEEVLDVQTSDSFALPFRFLYRRSTSSQFFESLEPSGIYDFLSSPATDAWGLVLEPRFGPADPVQVRLLHWNLAGHARPMRPVPYGAGGTFVGDDHTEISILRLDSPATGLRAVAHRQSSSLTAFDDFSAAKTFESSESFAGLLVAWAGALTESHQTEVALRFEREFGLSLFSGWEGTTFTRVLDQVSFLVSDQWTTGEAWNFETNVGLLALHYADVQTALETLLVGRARVTGSISIRRQMSDQGQVVFHFGRFARPAGYGESLYLASESRRTWERGDVISGVARLAWHSCDLEWGAQWVDWHDRLRWTWADTSIGGSQQWGVLPEATSQTSVWLRGALPEAWPLRSEATWRLDAGDLWNGQRYLHRGSVHLGGDWLPRSPALRVSADLAVVIEAAGGGWDAGLSARGAIAITDDFEAAFVARDLVWYGPRAGTQYAFSLDWYLWD